MENSVNVAGFDNLAGNAARIQGVTSAFNMVILMVGLLCVAAGYTLNHTSREQLAGYVNAAMSTQRSDSAPLGSSSGTVSGTLRDLRG